MSLNKAKLTPELFSRQVNLSMNVGSLIAVHHSLILSLAHKANTGPARMLVVEAVRYIGEELVIAGALTPDELKATYDVADKMGIPELKQMHSRGKIMIPDIPPDVNRTLTDIVRRSLERMPGECGMTGGEMFELQDGHCCACGGRIDGTLNIVSTNYRVKWKKPVWDNMLLKPGIENIPRAIAILCDKCISKNRSPVEVIEMEGKEVKYHPVKDMEEVFAITEDMLDRGEG